MLIDPLRADVYRLLFQPARNLFRTPILSHFLFNYFPSLCQNTFPGRSLRPPFLGFFTCLFGAIASFPLVSGQFSADARFMHFKLIGDFCLTVSYFLQCRNLVSLFRSKLVVASHSAPLTWSSEKHYYPTPACFSTTFKVA